MLLLRSPMSSWYNSFVLDFFLFFLKSCRIFSLSQVFWNFLKTCFLVGLFSFTVPVTEWPFLIWRLISSIYAFDNFLCYLCSILSFWKTYCQILDPLDSFYFLLLILCTLFKVFIFWVISLYFLATLHWTCYFSGHIFSFYELFHVLIPF